MTKEAQNMILADKIIKLRKKAGWSQEEFAELMDVSRQSVSKWEGAQSIPDYNKLIKMSGLFGVTIDYLLKEEIEEEEHTETTEEIPQVRRVSMEEANAFLEAKKETAPIIAYGVFLCIISPVCLIFLATLGESGLIGMSEDTGGLVGLIILFVMVAIAVGLFIHSGSKTEKYEYLEKEIFETEYGVTGMVKEKKEAMSHTYTRNNIIATSLCILAVVPLFSCAIIDEENEPLMVGAFCLLLVIVGVAVVIFVRGGIMWESYSKLLQEGEYSKVKKAGSPLVELISTVYWLVITAAYLGISLFTMDWHITWIIWVIAGVLYPAVAAIAGAFDKKK